MMQTYTISEFARTKGAKDKQERKKRSAKGYISPGIATAVGTAAALKGGKGSLLRRAGQITAGAGLVGAGLKALGDKKEKAEQAEKAKYDKSLKGRVDKLKSKGKETYGKVKGRVKKEYNIMKGKLAEKKAIGQLKKEYKKAKRSAYEHIGANTQ